MIYPADIVIAFQPVGINAFQPVGTSSIENKTKQNLLTESQ